MNKGGTLSVGRKLLLPNPTKDPTKKPAIAALPKPAPTPSVKPANTAIQAAVKAPVVKKVPAKDPQTISYGDYALSLKVSK